MVCPGLRACADRRGGHSGVEEAQGLVIMELRRSVITGRPAPALPSWLTELLWDQFAALLPQRPVYDPAHPLGCHRPRISDRISNALE